MMYGWGPGWHGQWIMPGMMLAWIVLIVLGVYALIKWIRHMGPPNQTGSDSANRPAAKKTAIEIIEEAYARGEISREEFLQKRDDLTRK